MYYNDFSFITFQITLADINGPRIEQFYASLPSKLVEFPWNFSEEEAAAAMVWGN